MRKSDDILESAMRSAVVRARRLSSFKVHWKYIETILAKVGITNLCDPLSINGDLLRALPALIDSGSYRRLSLNYADFSNLPIDESSCVILFSTPDPKTNMSCVNVGRLKAVDGKYIEQLNDKGRKSLVVCFRHDLIQTAAVNVNLQFEARRSILLVNYPDEI